MKFPAHAVTRTAPLKFNGIDVTFKLSHALFSSRKIDEGTMLLLKTLAQQKAVPDTGRVLDSGCGVGSLAVALKKRYPQLEMHARDRLMLACAFTEENARLNKVNLSVEPGLLMEGDGSPYDLVVSNIPAKAGGPVLADSLSRAGEMLTPTGRVAIVIVTPLAEWARTTLDSLGAEILWQEDSYDYRVIHYRFPNKEIAKVDPLVPFPGVYQRNSMRWESPTGFLDQITCWGLPNFDELDYRLKVTFELLDLADMKAPALVWEPEQGHSSSALARMLRVNPTIAGNDWLALKTAMTNLGKNGFPPSDMKACATISDLEILPAASFNSLIINLHTEPDIKWTDETRGMITHLLAVHGQVLVTGSSTDLSRFLEEHEGLKILRDQKYRGWRAALLQRIK